MFPCAVWVQGRRRYYALELVRDFLPSLNPFSDIILSLSVLSGIAEENEIQFDDYYPEYVEVSAAFSRWTTEVLKGNMYHVFIIPCKVH